jgi:hypothetical protein
LGPRANAGAAVTEKLLSLSGTKPWSSNRQPATKTELVYDLNLLPSNILIIEFNNSDKNHCVCIQLHGAEMRILHTTINAIMKNRTLHCSSNYY